MPARPPGIPRRRGVRHQRAEVPQPAAHRQAGGSGQPSLWVHLRQLPWPGWQDVHSIGGEEVSARVQSMRAKWVFPVLARTPDRSSVKAFNCLRAQIAVT